MNNQQTTELLDFAEQLIPISNILPRVLAITASPDCNSDDLARVILSEPMISARILRIANSSFYGMQGEVSQVSRAIVILGTVAIRNLVISLSVHDSVAPIAEHDEITMSLWKHSVAVATVAECIAHQLNIKPAEELFVCGLLHDIGQIVMFNHDPAAFKQTLEIAHEDGFLSSERELFGANHSEIGEMILRRWGLSDTVCEVILNHHQPAVNPQNPTTNLMAVIVLADVYAQLLGYGIDIPVGQFGRAQWAAGILGLTDQDQVRVMAMIDGRFKEILSMMSPDILETYSESAPTKRVVWLSSDPDHRDLRHHLIEHMGFTLSLVGSDTPQPQIGAQDIVLMDSSFAQEFPCELSECGVLVKLQDFIDGNQRIELESGILQIPEVFSAYDLRWVFEKAG